MQKEQDMVGAQYTGETNQFLFDDLWMLVVSQSTECVPITNYVLLTIHMKDKWMLSGFNFDDAKFPKRFIP